MATLDRILASVQWEAKYPLARVKILPKEVSDHNPLLITFGEKLAGGDHIFRFEKWWFKNDGFENLVIETWNSECQLSNPVDRWQIKIRNLRKKLQDWSRNINAEMRKNKSKILAELDKLDANAEQNPIFDQELIRRKNLREEIEQVWKVEEIRSRQKSRERDIKEGDQNTAYCFAKANYRKRKKMIVFLEEDGMTYNKTESMSKYATEFYKKLFGREPRENLRLDENFWEEDEKVTNEENQLLQIEFSEEEIKTAIDASYAEGAPGPDGFSFMFYQKF
jgi:hypothetical protein